VRELAALVLPLLGVRELAALVVGLDVVGLGIGLGIRELAALLVSLDVLGLGLGVVALPFPVFGLVGHLALPPRSVKGRSQDGRAPSNLPSRFRLSSNAAILGR